MTTPVCVGPEFRVGGGVLDISFYWGKRMFHTAQVNASNDGAFTLQSPVPGTNHIDTSTSYLNNTGHDLNMWVEIIPASRYVKSSQPNLTFLRHRSTYAVGFAPNAETPDIAQVFDSEFGGGYDRITPEDETPISGVAEFSQPIMPYWLENIIVPDGQTLQVKYRCARYNPDPWSETANNNVAVYDATARWVRFHFWGSVVGVN